MKSWSILFLLILNIKIWGAENQLENQATKADIDFCIQCIEEARKMMELGKKIKKKVGIKNNKLVKRSTVINLYKPLQFP